MLEAKAKDQEHRYTYSQKKKFQVISKKSLQKVFSDDLQIKKGHQTNFQAISKRGKQKRSSQIFHEISGVFQQNFNGSKNSAALEPRTGQFLRT